MNKFKKMDDDCYESSFLVKIKLVMARLFEKKSFYFLTYTFYFLQAIPIFILAWDS